MVKKQKNIIKHHRKQLTITKQLLYIVTINIVTMLNSQAQAKPTYNSYVYSTPSTEMDFELPAIPTISENPELNSSPSTTSQPQTTKQDPSKVIDNFFSSAPINPDILAEQKTPDSIDTPKDGDNKLPPEDEDKTKESQKKPAKKWWKKPKIKFVKNRKNKHKFRSQIMPETIYKRDYSNDNKHLPEAWYKHDITNAMVLAVERGNIRTMRSLYKSGININMLDYNGEPLLTHAIRFGALNSVEWLLIHGANVSEISKDGVAPLHIAAYSGNQALMTRLLDHGANPNQLDAHGVSPLIYAQKGRVPESVRILYEYGATSQTAYLE